MLYEFLAGPQLPNDNGRARFAPYALRKVEAALLTRHTSDEVVVAHPKCVHLFIREDTRVIGIHTMDPVGLGPVTMMFTNGRFFTPLVEAEFKKFTSKLHQARTIRNSHAKIVVGGPGSWEFSYRPALVRDLHVDHVVQGEVDDSAVQLFDQLTDGSLTDPFMFGFQTFDEHFRKLWSFDNDHVFVTRAGFKRQFPALDEIPTIKGATMKGIVEVMRGCGIGCDFCEANLRPLRYFDPETVKKEIEVNRKAGLNSCWFHSDEIFAYGHGRNFEPNQDALVRLFSAVMETGVARANPTHGRISIPAAYPELIGNLSEILHAGPENWIGIQIGLETGSDRLARRHMPNKTLPLRIGPDGTWAEIITEGAVNLNRNYWRPAFTVQIGQGEETPDDNWETVGLINDMNDANLEFTVTPLVNVPLGLLKSRGFYPVYDQLDEAQASVIYACFRHLRKIVFRNVASVATGNPAIRFAITQVMTGGMAVILAALEHMFKMKGFNMDRAKKETLGERRIDRILESVITRGVSAGGFTF